MIQSKSKKQSNINWPQVVAKLKAKQLKLTKKNTQTKMQKLNNAFTKLDAVVPASNDTLEQYAHMLLHREAPATRVPLLNMGKSHLRTIRYRVAKTVNASTGNCISVINPTALAAFNTSATGSPCMLSSDADYDPNYIGNDLTGLDNWDGGIVSSSGINLTNFDFTSVATIACHINVTISGVSALDKKGKIYIAEDVATDLNYGYAEKTEANKLANKYILPNMVKLHNFEEIEIANMNSDSTIQYSFIPRSSYANTLQYIPTAYSSGEMAVQTGNQLFILIVTGATAGMQIQIDYKLVFQARPSIELLNTYPTEFSTCFKNPDRLTRWLEQDQTNKLKVRAQPNYKLGYFPMLKAPMKLRPKIRGPHYLKDVMAP